MALKAAIDNFFGMSSRNTLRPNSNSNSGSGGNSGFSGPSGTENKGSSDNRSLQKAAAIDAIAVAFDR